MTELLLITAWLAILTVGGIITDVAVWVIEKAASSGGTDESGGR